MWCLKSIIDVFHILYIVYFVYFGYISYFKTVEPIKNWNGRRYSVFAHGEFGRQCSGDTGGRGGNSGRNTNSGGNSNVSVTFQPGISWSQF